MRKALSNSTLGGLFFLLLFIGKLQGQSLSAPQNASVTSQAASPVAYPDSAAGAEYLLKDIIKAQKDTDAARQWRYVPTPLNGEPVEVETEIDVIFSLRR